MKETRKQIVISTRQQCAKEYNKLTDFLRSEKKHLYKRNRSLSDSMKKIEKENDNLKEENRMLKEWIERLADYVNIPEEERKAFFEPVIKPKTDDNVREPFLSSPFISHLSELFGEFFID